MRFGAWRRTARTSSGCTPPTPRPRARCWPAGRSTRIFLDVVFDRTPPDRLVGDPARGVEHLARNQGFHVLAEIAPLVAAGVPVLLAHDFSNQGGRLQALRERVPGWKESPRAKRPPRVLERLTASAS